MKIYCCGCERDVDASLVTGAEIYPSRADLSRLPFWQCECGCYVGCHHKSRFKKDRTKPLGCIPTPELRKARGEIHKILDPIWKRGLSGRGSLYRLINSRLGYEYHTAEIRSIDEARKIYRIVRSIREELIAAEGDPDPG